MRLLLAAPAHLTQMSHLDKALKLADLEPDEVVLPETQAGAVNQWLKNWAKSRSLEVKTCSDLAEGLRLLTRGPGGAVVAILSPDQPSILDLVAEAESRRIPVFLYRELYRQDPRVNCRFSPVDRPDVWLKALTAEQRDFFRRLHGLCSQYGVTLKTSQDGHGGSVLEFSDGVEFEGVELDSEACRVRPRGSVRYRRIVLD